MTIIRKTLSNGKVIRKGIMTRGRTCIDGKHGTLVTGLNEGVSTWGDYAFNLETYRMTKRSIREARKARTDQYMDASADFQLYRGANAFGKPRSMTGREAWNLNQGYEKVFFHSKDPEARLWRWYHVGAVVSDKPITVNEYRRQRFEKSTLSRSE